MDIDKDLYKDMNLRELMKFTSQIPIEDGRLSIMFEAIVTELEKLDAEIGWLVDELTEAGIFEEDKDGQED